MGTEARAEVLIAGGGTAGHVLPGIAIARALVAAGRDPGTIHFVGSERGIEVRLVPEAGFGLTVLPGRGLQRRLTAENLASGLALARAVARAVVLVRRRRPAVVVGLGGYASIATVIGAACARVPVVVAEQNAVAGAANRIAALMARASAISFPGTRLRHAVLTGNPVRSEVRGVDRVGGRAPARDRLGVDQSRTLITVFGGSLGARRLNEAALAAAAAWIDRSDLAIRHVVGQRDWTGVSEAARELAARGRAHGLQYLPTPYEDDMPSLYAASDLAVCRAGATSVAELAVVGLPAVLVPLPGAPRDHQTANARALAEAGAAVVLPDSACTGTHLAEVVNALVAEPARLADMARAAAAVARPDAAGQVAALIEEHARG